MSLASFNRARRMAAEKAAKEAKVDDPKPLNKMKKSELLEVAGELMLDVNDKMTNKELIALIEGK